MARAARLAAGFPAEPNPARELRGAPGCVASEEAGVVAVVGARRGEIEACD